MPYTKKSLVKVAKNDAFSLTLVLAIIIPQRKDSGDFFIHSVDRMPRKNMNLAYSICIY